MTAMVHDKLVRAWIWLLTLSVASTAIAFLVSEHYNTTIAGCIILGLALVKARLILSQYLRLAEAPLWRRGFNFVLTLFVLVAIGLFLIPTL